MFSFFWAIFLRNSWNFVWKNPNLVENSIEIVTFYCLLYTFSLIQGNPPPSLQTKRFFQWYLNISWISNEKWKSGSEFSSIFEACYCKEKWDFPPISFSLIFNQKISKTFSQFRKIMYPMRKKMEKGKKMETKRENFYHSQFEYKRKKHLNNCLSHFSIRKNFESLVLFFFKIRR